METYKIIEKLRDMYNILCDGEGGIIEIEYFNHAADRLEELEKENSELKKQLSEQTQWISVEDERKPKHLQNYFIAYVFGNGKEHFFREAIYIADKGNGIVDGPHFNDEGVDGMRVTHWMEIPKVSDPPKPKEPSFKDVFLKAFPKASFSDVCCCMVFTEQFVHDSCDYNCNACWNQPYFEEEEGEADA